MRVIVAGSMTWDNAEAIRAALRAISDLKTVVHGDAPGADALAGSVALALGLKVEPFAKNSDDYKRYKRGAWKGLNERMLASGVELVMAFHPAIDKSRGTKHLVELAQEAGVPVRVFAE